MSESEFPLENIKQLYIEVKEDQSFSYYPPDWNYREGDALQFLCNEGPFTVTYVPFELGNEEEDIEPTVSPFGYSDDDPLILEVEGNVVQEGTSVERYATQPYEVVEPGPDGLAKLAEHNGEYVEIFHYHVKVRGGEEAGQPEDKTRNGMWVCG